MNAADRGLSRTGARIVLERSRPNLPTARTITPTRHAKGVIGDAAQGQVFELKKLAVDGSPVWAYRYRTDGPSSRRLQRGGFSSERDAAEALERALEHLRRQKGVGSTLTLKELVDEYLGQHDAEPETIDKLSWLLAKALRREKLDGAGTGVEPA